MLKPITLLRLIAIDCKRVFTSYRFWCTILIIWLIMSISVYNNNGAALDVIALCDLANTGSGTFLLTLCILPTIPYSTSYASDYNTKATRQWSIRCGIAQYAASKFIVAVISGMLTYFMGMIVFSVIASFKLPLFDSIVTGDTYVQLLSDGKPLQYLCCYLIHYALSAALMAGCAFFVTTLIPNAFMATAVPVVFYFLYLRICNFVAIPEAFNAVKLIQSICPADTPAQTMLAKVVPVSSILIVLCFLSILFIRRRSLHE